MENVRNQLLLLACCLENLEEPPEWRLRQRDIYIRPDEAREIVTTVNYSVVNEVGRQTCQKLPNQSKLGLCWRLAFACLSQIRELNTCNLILNREPKCRL